MGKKERLYYALGGFGIGVALMAIVWLCVSLSHNRSAETGADNVITRENVAEGSGTDESTGQNPQPTQFHGESTDTSQEQTDNTDTSAEETEPTEKNTEAAKPTEKDSEDEPVKPTEKETAALPPSTPGNQGQDKPEPPAETKAPAPSGTWDKNAVYVGGDLVSYNGQQYKAKWWTQGETPGSSDVWERLGTVSGEPTPPEGVENVPIDSSKPQNTELTDFKVVGYYPSWKPDKLNFVDFGVLTHVCYAFAIPTSDGGLRDLENPETAKALIKSAHANKAKVLLSIGGWSYNDTPLEGVFMEATSTKEKTERFAENIIAMCDRYGFDGVDMDWEHPRTDGTSAKQYESLMLCLSEKLHAKGKLLTSAVLSGATADGNIYYDAAAHTNAVLNAVDFINIMAYDGGDGERHSQYDFAVNCGKYWKETRGLPAYKVVLGVPFYGRPSWAGYGDILASVPDADSKDHVNYNGMEAYYNGTETIAKKTRYAKENLGGIMIWELTQDSTDKSKSLLQTIGKNAG